MNDAVNITDILINKYLKIQAVPQSKHSVSVIKTSQLMLYREIIAVCSQIHTKHLNTLCGQNVELLNVKLAVHTVTSWLWEGLPKFKFSLFVLHERAFRKQRTDVTTYHPSENQLTSVKFMFVCVRQCKVQSTATGTGSCRHTDDSLRISH